MIDINNIEKVEMNSIEELKQIIIELKELLNNGLIKEIKMSSDYQIELIDLDVGSGLPDYFEIFLYSKKYNKKYLLAIETFHGTGGSLKLVKEQ